MIRRLFITGIYSIIALLSMAQDPLFTQYYHSPLYLAQKMISVLI
jgi:hypothetical protein